MTSRPRPARSRRRRPLSGYAALLLLLAVIGTAYAAVAPSGRAAARAQTSTDVEAGRLLYATGCSTCHGLLAQGSTQGPSLLGVGSAAVDFQVSTGRMPLSNRGPQADRKDPKYTEQQILQLAAYIDSLAPGGPKRPTDAELNYSDANLAEGGELFRTNCASCHNFAGRGGALTHGKYAPELNPSTPRQIYEAMLSGPESMPVFGDRQITPEQKLAIIAHIQKLQAEGDPGGNPLGRFGPVPEGLAAWLIGIVALAGAALWIGARA